MNNYEKYRRNLRWFDNDELHLDLKNKSIKGGVSTSASHMVCFGINTLSTFILARILFPSDFGLVGMVTAFTGFISIIKDLGLDMAVIQREKITHKEVSNLFWVNILIGGIITIIFILASPLIVTLYHHDARLYPIIISYALGIGISGLTIQHYALMSRRMLFAKLAKIDIFSTAFSVILGITAALLGMRYWAIVVINLSYILINILFLWIYCTWRPSLPFKNQSVKEFLHFGAGISGSNIVSYFTGQVDNVLIGRMIGATALGFYSKAYQLVLLPVNRLRNPLVTVAIPAMSKLLNEPGKYVHYYQKYVFLLAFFSMPLMTGLSLFSKELILVMLGNQWMTSSYFFSVLAFQGFIQPVYSSGSLIMITSGRAKRLFIIGCLSSVVTILGYFIGIHWGVMGVCISSVASTYLTLLPVLYFSFKGTSIKLMHFFKGIYLPIIHSLCMGGLLFIAKIILNKFDIPELIILMTLSPTGAIFYYFSWKIYPKGREHLKVIDDLFHLFIQKLRRVEEVKVERISSVVN